MLQGKHRWLRHLTPLALVAALGIQLYASLLVTSVTVDEFAHLPAGIVYWEQQSFAPYHHNPPLLRMIAAAPLMLMEVDTTSLGPQDDRWLLGLKFQHANQRKYHALFTAARLPMIGLTLLTALLIYYWTEQIAGYGAALVAMLLFCFSPTMLAHGGLVTTDAGFSLAFLSVVVTAIAVVRRSSWPRAALLGLLVGLAQLTKFTAIIIFPLLLLTWIFAPRTKATKRRRRERHGERLGDLGLRQRCLRLAAVVAIAGVVLNAGYLFQGTLQPWNRTQFANPVLKGIADSALGSLPSLLPAEYLRGFDAQYRESQGVFPAYFLGQLSTDGWLHYYATALLLKVPLPCWLLLAGTVILVARGTLACSLPLASALLLPAVALIAFSIFTNINLGVRYLLFVLPLLHVATGHFAVAAAQSRKLLALLVVCLAWYVASSLGQFPHYLSYFSDVVGRAGNGHRLLADSNLDWGQDLIHLRQQMERRGIDKIALAHFGLVDPHVYGINYEPLSPQASAEVTAISLNLLLGIDPWGQGRYVGLAGDMRLIGRAGYSIWLFRSLRQSRERSLSPNS